MRLRLLIPGALVLALAPACGEEFDPPSLVKKMRVLAIRAEAPEIAPLARAADGTPLEPQPEGRAPDRTTFTSLVADPKQLGEPAREVTMVYLACTPEPGSIEAGICSLIETYADPSRLPELLAGGAGTDCAAGGGAAGELGQGVVGQITFAGFEACDHELGCRPVEIEFGGIPFALPPPTYILPAAFTLDDLPDGHPQRTNGVQVLTIGIAVIATTAEIVEGADPADACAFASQVSANIAALLREREQLTAIKRVQVRGPDNEDELNINPEIPGMRADGSELPADLADPVQAGARVRNASLVRLLPLLPTDDDGAPLPGDRLYQPFTRYDGEGNVFRAEREAWLWSWFTTAGEFEREITRDAKREQEWTAPGDRDHPVPEGGRVFLYSVVRDARGGIAWAKREVRVE